MSTTITKLYANNVTFVDEAEGRYLKERPKSGERFEDFYMFKCKLSPEDYKTTKAAIDQQLHSMGGEDPFVFHLDPLDPRSDEEQKFYAYAEHYGADRARKMARPDGSYMTYRPMDCVLTGPELSLMYFRQLDPPRVNGATEYENIRGREGSIQFHLIEYANGQIHAYCDYINLIKVEDDYVPSGLDDGGMF